MEYKEHRTGQSTELGEQIYDCKLYIDNENPLIIQIILDSVVIFILVILESFSAIPRYLTAP